MQHQMQLATEPFNKIASGAKLIESRLFDEKRQQISLDDIITFTEKNNPQNIVKTVVKALLRYKTFNELFQDHDPILFGGEGREFLLRQIKNFYSTEDENKYGVVGLRLELIS